MAKISIMVNGTELDTAQCTAVRVAISDLLMQLADPAERAKLKPGQGEEYQARLGEVERLLVPQPLLATSQVGLEILIDPMNPVAGDAPLR